MNFESKQFHESKACPGVRYAVRTLNVVQRSRRDLDIAEDRLAYTRLLRSFQELDKDARTGPAGEEIAYKMELLVAAKLYPATLRAGIADISGIKIDGSPATVEGLIGSGPTELLREMFDACEEGAGLSEGDSKNLPSPGTSAGPEDGESGNSTAMSVSGESTTDGVVAGSISPDK